MRSVRYHACVWKPATELSEVKRVQSKIFQYFLEFCAACKTCIQLKYNCEVMKLSTCHFVYQYDFSYF